MSAFIRRQPVRTVELGTRPGLHGQVLISSGLAGMDKLLGGGLPLGSIMLIIEDSDSQQHNNILKCFMAEGVCCKHTVAWVSAEAVSPESIAAFLPSTAKPYDAETQQQVWYVCCSHPFPPLTVVSNVHMLALVTYRTYILFQIGRHLHVAAGS